MKKGVFLFFLFSILLVVSFGENVSSQVNCCGDCLESMCDMLELICDAYDNMWASWCAMAEANVPEECTFSCGSGGGGPCRANCIGFGPSCVTASHLSPPIEDLLLSPDDCSLIHCALAGCSALKACGPYYYKLDCTGGGDCDGQPCPPPPPPPPPPTCGDGVCDGFPEFCGNCEEDCGECEPTCGDGVCDSEETCDNCWSDCWMECGDGFCGDGVCEGGETCTTCETDCGGCGDGVCGDGVCDSEETCVNCFPDCGGCGDGVCGDGIIQQPNSDGIYEECDDGNILSGDGCSSSCDFEGCHLRSNFYLASDSNSNLRADAGERIGLRAYLLGDCDGLPSYDEIVIEGVSLPDGGCSINPYLGDMHGMIGSIIWAVPTIPQECEGEQIYGSETYLRDSAGNIIIQSDDVIGSFIFAGDAGEDTFCGDGEVQEPNDDGQNEECDDGMQCFANGPNCYNELECIADGGTCQTWNNDECSDVCLEEVDVDTFCGDGEVQEPNDDGQNEECDDGNNDDGDGCSANCLLDDEVDCDDLVGQEGWFGEYYNYPKAHPDMDREMGNQPTGDPLNWNEDWEHNWYDDSYYRFYRIDDDLEFGQEFFPFDMAPEEFEENGHEHYFGTHWRALVTSDESRDYLYSLRSDDDSWMYITSTSGLPELIANNSGIHNANDAVQNIINFEKDITYTVDVFFAERKTESSELTFSFHSPTGELVIEPFPEDCEEIIGPSLEAEWYEGTSESDGSAAIGETVTMHVDVTNINIGETIVFELYEDDGNEIIILSSMNASVIGRIAEIDVELTEELFEIADDDSFVDSCDFNNYFELVFNATWQDTAVNATSGTLEIWCGDTIPLFTIKDVPFFGFAQGIAVVILIILIYFFLSRKQFKKKKK